MNVRPSAPWVHVSFIVGALGLAACGDDGDAGADVFEVAEVFEVFEIGEVAETAQTDGVGTADSVPAEVAEDLIGDTAEADASVGPLPGFGAITGACGVVADELEAPSPSLFVNHIDFGGDPYDESDLAKLTDGGREILKDGNAGGSSILSEVFAFEMLARCDGAVLLKTENEIVYDVAAKITDMIVEIDGHKVGANPTRAVGFPFDAPYTVEQARTIIEKKLGDINSSSASVSAGDRWVKQILTVFAYSEDHLAPIETAWNAIDATLRADTIVIVTVTDGDDRFIYSN